MKAICCMDIAGNVGSDNETGLPWKFPEDLERFKSKTMDSTIIVGSKTAKLLPYLKGRQLAVLSRTQITLENNPNYIWIQPGRVHNTFVDSSNVWVIGGNRTWLSYNTKITEWHITRIFKVFNSANAVFNFNLLAGFKCTELYDSSVAQFKATTEVWTR